MPRALSLLPAWRAFRGLIRSFIGDFGVGAAGSGRVCFKTGAAQLLESD
jgi:hypothetical protein